MLSRIRRSMKALTKSVPSILIDKLHQGGGKGRDKTEGSTKPECAP